MSRVDPTNGEIIETIEVGSPSQQDPTAYQDSILEVETAADTVSLVSRSADLSEEWSVVVGDTPYARDLQVEGTTAVVTTEGSVVAASLETHEVLWSHEPSRPPSSPEVTPDAVFVPSGRRVTALDIATGEVMWSRLFESQPATPVASSDVVITGPSRPSHGDDVGRLRGLDPETGEVVWRSELPGARTFRPYLINIGNGLIVDLEIGLGGTRTTLIGVEATSGTEQWRRTFRRDGIWEFIFDRGSVIVVPARPARAKVLDETTGVTLYSVRIPRGWALFDAVLRGDQLLLTSRNNKTIDIRASEEGDVLWKTRIEAARIPHFVGTVGDNILMTLTDQQGTNRGDLALLDANGQITWRTKFPQAIVMEPVSLGEDLFVLSADAPAGCV